ncbi:MAG TPA: chemotaxis protein CheW [Gemmataceae bacterium]|nr:chemotaxis protein CheW [Gemmataceae bacterium]
MKAQPKVPTGSIDWRQIHDRLARARRATEESVQLSPERARAVMEERALALARVPPRAPDAAEVLEVVTFSLANERYAVETCHAHEVVRFGDLTPVPGAPDFLVGLHNLRGEILAVFDLRRFFGVADQGLTELARLVVLGGDHAEFGVLADAVHEVTILRIDEVHGAPASAAGPGREYLRGVSAGGLVVLDGAVLLRDSRLFIDQAEEAP